MKVRIYVIESFRSIIQKPHGGGMIIEESAPHDFPAPWGRHDKLNPGAI